MEPPRRRSNIILNNEIGSSDCLRSRRARNSGNTTLDQHAQIAKNTPLSQSVSSRSSRGCAKSVVRRASPAPTLHLSAQFVNAVNLQFWKHQFSPPTPNECLCFCEAIGRLVSRPVMTSIFSWEYIRGLRVSHQFHRTCIHLVSFIESIYVHIYGSSKDATDLLECCICSNAYNI